MNARFHSSSLPLIIRISCALFIILLILYFLKPVLGDFSFTVMVFFFGIGICISIGVWVDCHFKRIHLTDTTITFISGILNTKETLIPFDRITNVVVKRSFLERILGLGSIVIDTPGGTVVPEIEAHHIKYSAIEFVLNKTKGRGSL